ncbi:hypothetical protein BC826DRAFT_155273 [Russula brevipes]|nr:hypothetical protein BC826DRAFT_155273 [Russula brevipes]
MRVLTAVMFPPLVANTVLSIVFIALHEDYPAARLPALCWLLFFIPLSCVSLLLYLSVRRAKEYSIIAHACFPFRRVLDRMYNVCTLPSFYSTRSLSRSSPLGACIFQARGVPPRSCEYPSSQPCRVSATVAARYRRFGGGFSYSSRSVCSTLLGAYREALPYARSRAR